MNTGSILDFAPAGWRGQPFSLSPFYLPLDGATGAVSMQLVALHFGGFDMKALKM